MSESTRNDELIEKLFGKLDGLASGHADIRQDIAIARAELQAIKRDLAVLHEVTFGNGTPEKGLVSRVQSLHEAEGRRKWLVGASVAAGFTAAAKLFVDGVSKLLH